MFKIAALAATLITMAGAAGRARIARVPQKKARHAALCKQPSKAAADRRKSGGQTIGGIAVSGAPSEADEAIARVAVEALLKL